MTKPVGFAMLCRKITSLSLFLVCFAVLFCLSVTAQSMPQVRLDIDAAAPRQVEDLTGTTIARHYALAWRDLASAMERDRSDALDDEFTGFAKERLTRRITEQQQAGLHVHIIDHGHQLKATFYSADGTAMQLVDRAQLEIQTFDGNRLLRTEDAPHEYLVLMTPGADRWYVRDLEEVSAK